MLLKTLVRPKAELTIVSEDASLAQALEVLETSGYRCVPVLDDTGLLFRGNIYKMHIYRHKSQGGDMSLPVTHLLKNVTKYVSLNSAFYKIFFSIKDLPYIAVLDDENHFYGILTHAKLLDMLSQSWNVNMGSYVLTLLSNSERGDLVAMSKIITKYTSISNCLTLDIQAESNRRILFTLPAEVSESKLKRIVAALERKHFHVLEIEHLQAD